MLYDVRCRRCGRKLNVDEFWHTVIEDGDNRPYPACRNQIECKERMPLCYGEKPDKLKQAAAKRVAVV